MIIVDLEATCWENQQERLNKQSEIIEIGAVKENGDEFQRFIKPVLNPILSPYCTRLTSIQQIDVDTADSFPIVIKDFIEWVGEDTLYSWGNYDKTQFVKDCQLHNIDWKFTHVNLKVEFSKVRKIKRRGAAGALKYLDLTFEGNHHRGIDDARNIMRIYSLIKESITPKIIQVATIDGSSSSTGRAIDL